MKMSECVSTFRLRFALTLLRFPFASCIRFKIYCSRIVAAFVNFDQGEFALTNEDSVKEM